MKEEKKDILKYSFTKYLDIAIKRARNYYISKEKRKGLIEELGAEDALFEMPETNMLYDTYADVEKVDWTSDEVRTFFMERTGENVWEVLSNCKDQELMIAFLKIYKEMTFEEIGKAMGLDWKKAAYVYAYFRRKMKRGLEKNGI